MHALDVGTVVEIAVRQDDLARLQERPHAVRARLAVDVAPVVLTRVERAAARVPREQELVEHRLPGNGVHGRRVGEDTVEVEQAQAHAVGQSQGSDHPGSLPRAAVGTPPAWRIPTHALGRMRA